MTKERTILFAAIASQVLAFHSAPAFHARGTSRLFSSTGGLPPPPPGKNSPEFDDFLNPNREESENMRLAREYMSEESLPISFGAAEQNREDSVAEVLPTDEADDPSPFNLTIGSGVTAGAKTLLDSPSAAMLANNPYMMVVSNLAPSDLISKFTTTAHPRVQNAVRATILGLIGNLPKLAFDTKTITTGQRLASLMFQLQMTGYMFKNAEYRLSLSQSLGMNSNPSLGQSSNFLLAGSEDDDDDEEESITLDGKVRGKIKIRYGGSNDNSNDEDSDKDPAGGFEMEVDAAAFTSELRSEVTKLRDELMNKRQEKSEALRKDLLLYIRTLPEKELKSLTTTVTQDVLVAMKGLVNVVMSGIGDDEIGPDTVTEQSGEAMAQLCMWQLVVGYNMRELEVRQQMKNSLMSKSGDVDEGVDFSGPGVLE
jgi:Protein of unknown function (DUF760)